MVDTGFIWKLIGDDIKGRAADNKSGRLVTLSADGNTVAIGSGGNNVNGENSGQITVFDKRDIWCESVLLYFAIVLPTYLLHLIYQCIS